MWIVYTMQAAHFSFFLSSLMAKSWLKKQTMHKSEKLIWSKKMDYSR